MAVRKLEAPETRARLLELLMVGTPRSHASRAVGASEDTLAAEMDRDPVFAEAVKEAEGDAVGMALKRIAAAAADGSWQAAAWFLERRYPKDFGRRAIVAADEEGAPMRFTIDLSTSGGAAAEAD